MKYIELTLGKTAIVDDADFKELSKHRWYAMPVKGSPFGKFIAWLPARKHRKFTQMHRLIMGNPPGLLVDHINGDTLDNRRQNLRVCTPSGNSQNRSKQARPASSKYKGVHWCSRTRKYVVRIRKHNVVVFSKYVSDETDAALLYNQVALIHHGEFAKLNEVRL